MGIRVSFVANTLRAEHVYSHRQAHEAIAVAAGTALHRADHALGRDTTAEQVRTTERAHGLVTLEVESADLAAPSWSRRRPTRCSIAFVAPTQKNTSARLIHCSPRANATAKPVLAVQLLPPGAAPPERTDNTKSETTLTYQNPITCCNCSETDAVRRKELHS